MSEPSSKVKKVYYVANPGSDSDDTNDDPYRRLRPHPAYPRWQQPQVTTPFPYKPSPPEPTVKTDLQPVNGNASHYQPHPPLSPDSTGSPVAEDPAPPPPTAPFHLANPPDLHPKLDTPSKPLPIIEPVDLPKPSRPVARQALKAPFGSRPYVKQTRSSPTTASSDAYPSPSSAASTSALPEKVVFVTADSERYVTVDISIARTAAQIRELILTKLNIYNDDENHPYAIYKTEIGAFAIGEALSNEQLLALCRDHGDSKGNLKFFVSAASAAVHEASPPLQPIEYNPVPPVLPSTIPPLRVARKSRSRNGSLSSQSESLPPVEVGYEADLDNPDRESNKSTPRQPTQYPSSIVSPSVPVPPRRRPSVVHHPRPASPLHQSSADPRDAPLSTSDRTRALWKEERFGHALPPLPSPAIQATSPPAPPPPSSPNLSSFPLQEDTSSSLTVPSRAHARTGSSDATVEREPALKSPEYSRPRTRLRDGPPSGKLRAESFRNENVFLNARRPYEEEEPSWDPVPTNLSVRTSGDDSERVSPSSLSRSTPRSTRYRSPYAPRVASRPPQTTVPDRPSSQPRPGQQPLPPNFVVTWKGEESGSNKKGSSSSSTSYNGRLAKTYTKSMDNLKLSSPTRRNPPPQLPTRPTNVRDLYSPGLTLSGSKPHDTSRTFSRPLPVQSASHSSSDYTPSMSYISRGGYPSNLMSPNQEPYPRPQSATGDSVISPTRSYNHRLQSPIYGSTLDSGDSGRSPRGVSPHRPFHTTGVPGPRPRPNNYHSDRSSDVQSGPETSNTTPPRTPISPQSPRHDSPEKNALVVEPSSPSQSEDHMIKDGHGSDLTLKQDDQHYYGKILSGTSSANTFVDPSPHRPPPPPPISNKSSKDSYAADDDEDDSDNEGGTWIVRPGPSRPPLTVQIDGSSPSSRAADSGTNQSYRPEVPPKDNPPSSRTGASTSRTPHHRPQSTFVDADNDSWAPRPPPENIYDHLEKFFPKHDLDKPVIEAVSGDISPTTSEPAAPMPPPVPVLDEKARIRAKKSIRIVAQEHKKRIDRTSRAVADAAYANNMLRKRNTKLWGSKLEEVTTGQARSVAANGGVPDSPSGGPTTFKWVRGELIGKGTYGRVYLALNATTGEMIAVKQVELPQTASDKNDSRQHMVVQALKMESETLRDLDHPNIVQYLGFEETPANLSIFLEYVPGGSVGSCLHKHGKFEDNVTRSFTAQILAGLEYLHSKGILHRDLKADNILVEMSGTCKISDFGISKRTEDIHGGAFTAMQGTVFWMAPEVINTQKSGYNFKIDIWSVGCVVLEMWAGMRPWMGEEMLAVMFKLYQSKQPPPVPEDVVLSDEADDFRRKCFAINPDERPSAAELRKHPYLILPPNWIFTGFT